MAGVVPVIPRIKFTDATGTPIAGGKVTVYYAGTTTVAPTYQDKDLTVANTSEITLDANGEALFWVNEAFTYKFLVKDSGGATVSGWPVDNVLGAGGSASGVSEITVDRFSGTGAQTQFTLSVTPTNGENSTHVYVGGVYKQKNEYSLAGNVLTFAVAPASGTNNIEVNTIGYTDYPVATTAIAALQQQAADSEAAAAASAGAASDSADASAASASASSASAAAAAISESQAAAIVLGDFLQSGTGAVARTFPDKLRDVVYVTDFMTLAEIVDVRSGTGSLDVTAAIQAAIDAADTVIFPPGKYRIVCINSSIGTYGNSPTTDIYRALRIDKSNLTLIGFGATIRVIGRGIVGGVNYAFATAKNMTLGTLTNFRVRGLKLDFDPTGDTSSSNKRSFHLVGMQGIFLDDIELTSSGARAGAAITIQNSKTVRINNLRLKNCTQGMNLSYVEDVQGSNWFFDNFSEAVDFDRKVVGFNLKNLSFINAPTGQALDLNSCEDGLVDGVYLDTVLNCVVVNYKYTTPPTYLGYVTTYTSWAASTVYTVGQYVQNADRFYICTTGGTSAAATGPTGTSSGIVDGTVVWDYTPVPYTVSPSKRVTIRGVRGDTVGSAAVACLDIGIDRTAEFGSGGPCEDIALEDVKLTNCGFVNIEDVKRFKLRDVVLDGVNVPTNSSYGAITISADSTYAAAEVSGEMRDVDIINATGKGVRALSPTRLVFDGVRVDGFNTASTVGNGYAFDLQGLNNRRGQLFIDRTLARSGNSSPVGWRFSESGSGSFESQIFWGIGNRIDIATVPTPIGFGQAGMQRRVKKRKTIPVGTIAHTSGTKDFPLVAATENEGIYLCYVAAKLSQTLAADGTNYVGTTVRSVISGSDASVAIGSFAAGAAAGAEVDCGLTFNETAVTLGEGDMAYVRLSVAGTGGTLQGLLFEAHYVDYATT